MTETFFHVGGIYRHYRNSAPSGEGIFVVVHVGHAPPGFEDASETGGVAFGWRRGAGPDGSDQPLGSYTTADFTGWREILDTELPGLINSMVWVESFPERPRSPTDRRRS
ncbi:hypothetical protein [Kitasatospora sp. NPDC059571]|uniref:hypothetical protein n=1 Tax=Kitasatospora sp. NPDC059571 TaxID=3346871 RepID=UPI003673B397